MPEMSNALRASALPVSEPAERHAELSIGGTPALADVSGALVLPRARALVVSDLHLEKGSAFAQRGQFLPPYDTADTLARLEAVIALWRPQVVVSLGDSFHDGAAHARLAPADAARIRAITGSVGRFIWVEGNHDPAPPAHLGGEVQAELTLDGLIFRHLPTEAPEAGEVAGHLHPVAKVRARGRSVRRRCFAGDGTRLIMPAFGAYAGGLNVCDGAFVAVFGRTPDAWILGRDRVWPASARRLCGD